MVEIAAVAAAVAAAESVDSKEVQTEFVESVGLEGGPYFDSEVGRNLDSEGGPNMDSEGTLADLVRHDSVDFGSLGEN